MPLAIALLIALPTPQVEVPAGVQTTPGPVQVDHFHPDREIPFEVQSGGEVSVLLASRPQRLNYMLENSAVSRHLLYELHESLIRRDWETWEYVPVLCKAWRVEDALVLEDGTRRFGQVTDGGDSWILQPPAAEGDSARFAKADVERVDREVLYSFELREGVQWHDGHTFDERDVLFSFQCWKNPDVRCDKRRYMFDKFVSADSPAPGQVRFFLDRPYFMSESAFDESLTILPSHIFDLADPDNPHYDPEATAEEQARFINENPANREWVGLGPYRLTEWTEEAIRAERFEGYFNPDDAGHVARIRWRIHTDLATAPLALLNGELDFLDRLSSGDYFGDFTASDTFREQFYRGHYFTPYTGYTAWNMKREHLSDARVRRALSMSFDWDGFIRGYYRGLAFRTRGDQWVSSPTCDLTMPLPPFDLEAAAALLMEAGWYDRDGDGLVDRDGEALVIELLMPVGNETSSAFGQLFQESLARIGVQLTLAAREFATLRERVVGRDFDAIALGTTLAFESDPEQLWHSRWADSMSSNRSGLADEETDQLIEALQVETRDAERIELFHRLQRRIDALQPYMFGLCAPRRFAMSRRIRNVQIFAIEPGYSIRRWVVTD